MPDILHTMTIIMPNSALPWSRVNDHKKMRWSLAPKSAGERGNQHQCQGVTFGNFKVQRNTRND